MKMAVVDVTTMLIFAPLRVSRTSPYFIGLRSTRHFEGVF